uniref:Uncharacterized protein n=1 Tax=Cacopsylla melanoneura TaxID=428564 RepID=A0A8D8R9C1_9HEMI
MDNNRKRKQKIGQEVQKFTRGMYGGKTGASQSIENCCMYPHILGELSKLSQDTKEKCGLWKVSDWLKSLNFRRKKNRNPSCNLAPAQINHLCVFIYGAHSVPWFETLLR